MEIESSVGGHFGSAAARDASGDRGGAGTKLDGEAAGGVGQAAMQYAGSQLSALQPSPSLLGPESAKELALVLGDLLWSGRLTEIKGCPFPLEAS